MTRGGGVVGCCGVWNNAGISTVLVGATGGGATAGVVGGSALVG